MKHRCDPILALKSSHSLLNQVRSRTTEKASIRMDRRRRKALKLLIVLIVEFFICWIPLYIYQTIGTFHKGLYRSVPSVVLDMILLFSFASTACNPLTYYFMSERYRTVLCDIFNCSYCRFSPSRSSSRQQRANLNTFVAYQERQKTMSAAVTRRMKSSPI